MQKQILYVSTLLCTITLCAMRQISQPKPIPHIVYNSKDKLHALEAKLTEKFSINSKCPKNEIALSHNSPQISRIHSNDYLNNLDQNTTATLASIDNTFGSWYPNAYSRSYLPPMLDNVHTTFAATECVVAVEKMTNTKPNYAISLAEGYSFAGHNQGSKGHVYAPIPIAAAYALQEHNDTIKRILVIDESITPNTAEYYFKSGNGSIFFPENNPELAALFNDTIVTNNQIADELWDFLHKPENTINLAFYNINIDDVEPIEGMHPADAKERNLKIWSLFYHFIPTVFIFSGDKNKHEKETYSTIKYIANTAQKIASFNNSRETRYAYTAIPQTTPSASSTSSSSEDNLHQNNSAKQCAQSIEKLLACMAKYPIPINIIIHRTNNILSESTESETSSFSSSSSLSLSGLEQKQHKLKKRLGLSSSSISTNDYAAAETSSTYDYSNDALSYGDEDNEKFEKKYQ